MMSHTITLTRREPHLSAEQRRALEILAAARVSGCTGAALLDHGFCTGMLADLVRDGLATARLESIRTGKRKIAMARVRGRRTEGTGSLIERHVRQAV